MRGHWEIEDRLHWVRDVTFDPDMSGQSRPVGTAPDRAPWPPSAPTRGGGKSVAHRHDIAPFAQACHEVDVPWITTPPAAQE